MPFFASDSSSGDNSGDGLSYADVNGKRIYMDTGRPNSATPAAVSSPSSPTMGKDHTGFYDAFLSQFLQTGNSLPINSLWYVQIDSIPSSINNWIVDKENWDIVSSLEKSETVVDSNKKGILIAQGVKVTGESMNISREGSPNTGYIKGLVGVGREPFPVLNIAFLENNLSFVDYCLRPWCIAVSHQSLKDATLKTNITITFLGKTGVGNEPKSRKIFIYEDCCPISINEEEYNYTGSDVYRLRQIQFAFNRYHIKEADGMILSLANAHVRNLTGSTPAGMIYVSDPKTDDTVAAKQHLSNAIIRKNPSQNDAVKAAQNIITGNNPNVLFNAVQNVQTIDDSVTLGISLAKKTPFGNVNLDYEKNVTNGISDTSFSASLEFGDVGGGGGYGRQYGGGGGSSGGPVGWIVKRTNQNDYVTGNQLDTRGKSINQDDYVNSKQLDNRGKSINQNDFVTSKPITTDEKSINQDDFINGSQLDNRGKSINQDDYISSKQLDTRGKDINQDDFVTSKPITTGEKSINQDDYISSKQLDNRGKNINQDDFITSKPITTGEKSINQNDYINSKKLDNRGKPINQDDFITSKPITTGEKSINQDDYIKKSTLVKYNEKVVNQNDTPIGKNIPYIVRNIK